MIVKNHTKQIVNTFLDAHPQHAVSFKIVCREDFERTGRQVYINLECHNGRDWMGLRAHCGFDEIDKYVVHLIKELHEYRPDLDLEVG